jgi:hypothetical protein
MYENEHKWTVDGTHAIESLVGGWVLDLDLDESGHERRTTRRASDEMRLDGNSLMGDARK